ncbi:hypothetical protein ScalyP_jg11864 [Parmales sp. scaly parma]|nr:hypothetical protein ScalyP_jg11864 [Parmales sp. scaly parma]
MKLLPYTTLIYLLIPCASFRFTQSRCFAQLTSKPFRSLSKTTVNANPPRQLCNPILPSPFSSPTLSPPRSPSLLLRQSSNTDNNEIEAAEYKSALVQTGLWVSAAIGFGTLIYIFSSPEAGIEFFAGYLVEQSLSVDNLFVFLLLFEYFKVPKSAETKILNWGIFGAMGMRAVMIGAGALALKDFHAILLFFAGILVYSSVKILYEFISGDGDGEEDMQDNAIVKFSKKLINCSDEFDGDNFFTLDSLGKKIATPLFLCMVAVEISDVVFAVDSIPAVFGVTENPLIVFSSNIFAIMGLRSLYSVLSNAVKDLKYLEPSVAAVLGFIGTKMIAEYGGILVPTSVSLGIVACILSLGVGVSLAFPDDIEEEEEEVI